MNDEMTQVEQGSARAAIALEPAASKAEFELCGCGRQ